MTRVEFATSARRYRTRKGRARRMVELAAAAAVAAIMPAVSFGAGPAGVEVQNVSRGSAQFKPVGNQLNIRTGARSTVINYNKFNLVKGEGVRFIQPSNDSRVLNRIKSAMPSSIDGNISGNGSVYFVNRAGITFGPNSVINVGRFFAAAGSISDNDFASGINRFDATGTLKNSGTIVADSANLIGRRVDNLGSVGASVVVMAAGDEVLIGPRAGQVFVKMDAKQAASAGGETLGLGAGDLYSLVLTNSGTIRGNDVTLAGGSAGAVRVGGVIDASNASGVGGNVRVLAGDISLDGVTINVSGRSGGGNVRVGGDFHGAGVLPTAQRTHVSADSTIHADALDSGAGGQVVVWSDQWTHFGGNITARGGAAGGDGGFVEVSGKQSLAFRGGVDTSAPAGEAGTILLDPENIEIITSAAEGDDTNVGSGGVDIGDGTGDYTISTAALEALEGDIILDAAKDITLSGNLDLAKQKGSENDSVTFRAGDDIFINANLTIGIVGDGGDLDLKANFDHAGTLAPSGVGMVRLASGKTITTDGGDVKISGATVGLRGNITAKSVDVHAKEGNVGFGTGVSIQADTQSYRAQKSDETGAVDAVTNAPKFYDSDGAGAPKSFTMHQDVAIVDALLLGNNVPLKSQFDSPTGGVPEKYVLESDFGAVTLEIVEKYAGAELKAHGAGPFELKNDVTVAKFDAKGSSVTLNGAIEATNQVFLEATDGDIAFNKNVKGSLIDASSGSSSGNGNITFKVVELWAGSQTYRGGKGTGTSIVQVDDGVDDPTFVGIGGAGTSPATFKLHQDQPLNDGAGPDGGIPATTQFGGGVPATYELHSLVGSVRISSPASVAGSNLTINAKTNASLANGLNLASLDVTSAPTTTFINGDITTVGSQTYHSAVQLNATANLTASGAGSVVEFESTVASNGDGKFGLTVTGDAVFGGDAGLSGKRLRSVKVTKTASVSADITTSEIDGGSGNQDYDDTLSLGDDATLSGFDGEFTAIDGNNHNLTLSFTNTTTLAGVISDMSELLSNAGGFTRIGGNVTSNAGGGQDYHDGVVLTNNVTLEAPSVRFGSTLRGDGSGTRSLTIQGPGGGTGVIATFVGNVGTPAFELNGLWVKGASRIGASEIHSAANVTFGGNVTLTQDVAIKAPSISFGGTIASVDENQLLALSGPAALDTAVTFDGDVGTTKLESLTVKGTTSVKTANISTAGTQSYSGDVTLAESATLSGSSIIFGADLLGGGFDLTLNSSTQDVGPKIKNVDDLVTNEAGTTNVTGDISVSGNITLNDTVKLKNNAVLTADNVKFGKTLNADAAGGQGVEVKGNVTFVGAVGMSAQLSYVTVSDGRATINGGAVWTTGAQTYNSGLAGDPSVILNTDTTLQGQSVSFVTNVDANSKNLTLNFSNDVTIGANLTELKNLTTDGPDLDGSGNFGPLGATVINGNIGTGGTTESVRFNDAVQLSPGSITIKGDTSVHFNRTIDGGAQLAIVSPQTTFNGKVGDGTALTSLSVSQQAAMNAEWVETTGGQTYSGDVTLDAPSATTSIYANSVTFSGKVQSDSDGEQSLAINGPFLTPAAGNVTFAGAVGPDEHLLNALTVNGVTTLNPGGGSITTAGDQTYEYSLTDGVGIKLNTDATLQGAGANFNTRLQGNNHDLTLNFTGIVSISDKFQGIRNLTTDKPSFGPAGKTRIVDEGQISTSGAQDYHDPVVLSDISTTLTTTSVTSKITFHNTLDADATVAGGEALKIVGDAHFMKEVGGIEPLASLEVTKTTEIDDSVNSIRTSGDQLYSGDVTLDSELTSFVVATATFGGKITGGSVAVTAGAAGNAVFSGAIDTGSLSVDGVTYLGAGTVDTSTSQTYSGEVHLTSANDLSAGTTVYFGGKVNGNYALDIDAVNGTTFRARVGGDEPLDKLTVTGDADFHDDVAPAGASSHNGQVYNDEVTLHGAASFTDDTSITFHDAVAGDDALHVDAPAIVLDGRTVTTDGQQTFSGAVRLDKPTIATAPGVTFDGTVNSQATELNSLLVNGDARFEGAVGTVASSKLSSLRVTGATAMNAGTVMTVDFQSYAGTVTLHSTTLLDNTNTLNGASIVEFDSNITSVVDGSAGLTINGAARFGDSVGAPNRLAFLTVNGDSTVAGPAMRTTGEQTYNGYVSLTGDTAMEASAILFDGRVYSETDGAHSLDISAAVTFNEAVGHNNADVKKRLEFLKISGAATVNGGSVTTIDNPPASNPGAGWQTYAGSVTLGANTIFQGTTAHFGGPLNGTAAHFDVTLNFSRDYVIGSQLVNLGDLTTDGVQYDGTQFGPQANTLIDGGFRTYGRQTYTDDVKLIADAVLISTGTHFKKTLSGAHALTLNFDPTPGEVTFSGDVGTPVGAALTSLTVNGNTLINAGGAGSVRTVQTSGGQHYNGNVKLEKDTQVLGSAATFAGAIDGSSSNSFLTITGDATFQGVVGTPSALQYLTVSGKTWLGAGTVNTLDGQTYSGAVTLTSNNVLNNTNNASAKLYFGNTVDGARDLTLNGNTIFKAYVGDDEPLTNLTANGTVNIDDTHPTIPTGGVETSGNQDYNGVVTLDSNALMVGLNITFDAQVRDSAKGAHDLAVTAGERVSFNAAVGAPANQLRSLLSNGGGVTGINGLTIDTTLTQRYDTPVELGNAATLTGSVMTFNDTVNSTTATPRALTIVGAAEFNGQIGTLRQLENLHVTKTTLMNAGIVTTRDFQTYDGAVTLVSGTTLNTDDDLVSFITTVDGGVSLTINSNAFFGGAAGGADSIASLIVNGNTNINGPLVQTSGDQTYNGLVLLSSGKPSGSAHKELTGADITFNDDLDSDGVGAHSLEINASNVFVNADIGMNDALKFVEVNAVAHLNVGGSVAGVNVETTQFQHYNQIVNLGADAHLVAGTDIIFADKVYDVSAGSNELKATAQGITQFKAPVGGDGKPLAKVWVDGPTNSQTHFGADGGSAIAVNTVGEQIYENKSTLMVNTTLAGSNMTFGEVIGGNRLGGTIEAKTNGGQSLTIDGNASLHGDIGAAGGRPAWLLVTGNANLNTDSIKTTGDQTYSGVVTLGPNVSAVELTLNSSTAHFGNIVDGSSNGGQSLHIVGNTTFNGNVGVAHALSALHVELDTTLAAEKVTTTLAQEYDGDFTLAGGGDKTLKGSVVSFGTDDNNDQIGENGLVNSTGAAKGMAIDGDAKFFGDVGGTGPLAFLSVSKNTTLTGQSIDAGAQTYLGTFTLRGASSVAAKTLSGNTVQFGTAAAGGEIIATNNGRESLTVNVSSGVTFNGNIGTAAARLSSLSVHGVTQFNTDSSYTSQDQTYDGAVVLGPNVADMTMTGANVIFQSTLAASANGGQSLTIAGNAQFDDNVGAGGKALEFLHVTGTTQLNGKSITTTGLQDYDGDMTLGGGGDAADKVLSASDVIFDGFVRAGGNGAQSMTLDADNVTFNADVGGQAGGSSALRFLAVNADATFNGTFITTTTFQSYSGDITLQTNMSLDGGTTITFGLADLSTGKIDGAHSLSAKAQNVAFNGNVGEATALTSLHVNADATLSAEIFETTGGQTYVGAVTLGANDSKPLVKITSGGPVVFQGTLDAHDNAKRGLSIVGNVVFEKAVGEQRALGALTIDGVTRINGGRIKTAQGAKADLTGDQKYLHNGVGVVLGGDTVLQGNNAHFKRQASDLSSTLIDGNEHDLTLNFLGTAAVGSNFGSIHDLTTDATGFGPSGQTRVFGNVTTSGTQTYNDRVVLDADTTFTGTILFNNIVDDSAAGAHAMLVLTPSVRFGADVGGGTRLGSLEVRGPSQLDGKLIHTSGAQTYVGAVDIGSAVDMRLDSAEARFRGRVNGGSLRILGDGGNAIFEAPVGDTSLGDAMTYLEVARKATIQGRLVQTTGRQLYSGDVVLTNGANLKAGTDAHASTIQFGGRLDGAGNLVIDAGLTTFKGAVSLGSLVVNGESSVDGLTITTTGGQRYGAPMTLTKDLVLTGSRISFTRIKGNGLTLTLDGSKQVTQEEDGQGIRVTDLVLSGAGSYSLVNLNNRITTLEANAGGAGVSAGIAFASDGNFQIGGSGLRVAAGKTVDLTSAAVVSQTAPISAGTLALHGVGDFVLGQDNTVSTLDLTPKQAGVDVVGAVSFVNVGDLTVADGVNCTGNLTLTVKQGALTAINMKTAGGVVTLNAAHDLTVSGTIDTDGGAATLTSGQNLTADTITTADASDNTKPAGGAVTVNATHDLTVNGVIDTDGGAATLTSGQNLTVGSITTTDPIDRIKTAGGAVTLNAVGDLTVSGAIDTDGGAATLDSAQNLTVGAITTTDPNDKTKGGNISLTAGDGVDTLTGTAVGDPAADPNNELEVYIPKYLIKLHGDLTAGEVDAAHGVTGSGIITIGHDYSGPNFPSVATIRADSLTIRGQEVVMGRGQKMTVPSGDLTIETIKAKLSDINVAQTLTVNAATFDLVRRTESAAHNVGKDDKGNTIVDKRPQDGVDFVATDIIVSLFGSGAPDIDAGVPPFAAVNYSNVTGTAPRRFNGEIPSLEVTVAGRAYQLDLKADGPAVADLGTSFAVALPAEMPTPTQESAADPAQKEVLYAMGISFKESDELDFIEWLVGRGLYDDAPRVENAQPADYKVTPNRLSRNVVEGVVREFWRVYNPKAASPLDHAKRAEYCAHVKTLIDSAVKDYRAAKKVEMLNSKMMADVRDYIRNTPAHAELSHKLDEVENLLGRVELLGLSPTELQLTRSTLLNMICPNTAMRNNMRTLVMPRDQTAARVAAESRAPGG